MRKRFSSAAEYKEDYLLNTAEFCPGQAGIRIHSFCHSLLMPDFRPNAALLPYILVSLILSGEDNYIDSDGDRILQKPGHFAISDLNQLHQKAPRRKHTLERYFVLIHVNRFLRDLLDRIFPAGLPKGQAPDPARLKRCFEDIRKVLRKPGETDNVLLGAMGFRLLCEAAEQFSPHSELPDALNLALQVIDNRFCDLELTRIAVAQAAGTSVVSLGNLFRKHLHTTVKHYITDLRLEKAKHLLEHSDLQVAEIAKQCGFSYSCYFARVFKEKNGILPGDYRRKKNPE
jgi:AraC-like DNA-binding protein